MSRSTIMLALGLVFLAGCSTEQQQGANGNAKLSELSQPLVGGNVVTYRVVDRPRSDLEIASRARRLAEIIAGKTLSEAPFVESYRQNSGQTRWSSSPDPALPSLVVEYDPALDDLHVVNTRLDEIASAEGVDEVSVSKASSVFEAALAQLDATHLVSLQEFDVSSVKEGATDFGSGRVGEVTPPQILRRTFKIYRQLGGFPIRNAYVKVSVHRTGVVSSIRLRGTALGFESHAATAAKLTLEGCGQRFANDFPSGVAEDRAIAYWLPMRDLDDAKLELQCSVAYVERQGGGQGISRRKYARYSLSHDVAPTVLGGSSGDVGTVDTRPR